MDHDKATPQELRWRIAQLEARLAEQERINKDIQGSTIWRATEPLRRILGPLSRLKRGFANHGTGPVLGIAPPFSPGPKTASPLQIQPFDPATSRFACSLDIVFDHSDPAQSPVNCALAVGQFWVSENAKDAVPIVMIDFSQGANSANYKIFGFESGEAWGSWTKGKRAQIHFWLPQTRVSDLEFHLVGAYRTLADKPGTARLRLNGIDLGPILFDENSRASVKVDLEVPKSIQKVPDNDHNVSLVPKAEPAVSVLILNYNKPYLTFLAVKALLTAKTKIKFEIIVLDNGSTPENATILASMDLPVRLIRLEENRFFGEGNNIAAEIARGERILFLNNDVLISDFTLDNLFSAFAYSPEVGACGPAFTYPDGTIQEVGAFLAKDGSVYQRGKGAKEFDFCQLPKLSEVDYVSAACLMVDRRKFLQMGGFDLRYDPAYYEDSDFCLRLIDQGQKTILACDSQVIHIENATTASIENKALSADLTERHRQIFLSRWDKWLENRVPENLPWLETFPLSAKANDQTSIEPGETINAAFTPYPLSQGGGERYLLGAALAMHSGEQRQTTAIVTPTRYSECRLNTLCRDLGLSSGILRSLALQQTAPAVINRYIHMGNELLPSAKGLGALNVFHCQFPFPEHVTGPDLQRRLSYLETYDVVVVNSNFTKDAYLRALAKISDRKQDVRVIYPGVEFVKHEAAKALSPKEKIILCIGRFCPKGHAKRQDLIVSAFKKLKSRGELDGWRLVLCGNVLNDLASVAYFEALRDSAKGIDVEFVLAPDRRQIEAYYRRASVYISATGAGVKHARDYHRCEHFGTTIVEAISAGCVPIVADIGGPVEILQSMSIGHVFRNEAGLVSRLHEATRDLSLAPQVFDLERLSDLYSEARSTRAWAGLWEDLEQGRPKIASTS